MNYLTLNIPKIQILIARLIIRKIYFILMLFIYIFLGCSNSRPELNSKPLINKNTYNIKYYKYEEYNYSSRSYSLLNKNMLINKGQLQNSSFYIKAYFDKDTNQLKRIDKIKFRLLDKVIIYYYSKNDLLLYTNTFVNNQIDTKSYYKNNIITHKIKYDNKKRILYTGKVKHLKSGREEKWYNKGKRLHYAILYSHINNPKEMAIYNKGIIKKIVRYYYNKLNQLIKEESFTRQAKLIGYKSFFYKNNTLHYINSYLMDRLVSTTKYDSYGREVELQYYDKDEVLSYYVYNEYGSNGKTVKEYDNNNSLTKVSKYTTMGELKSLERIESNRTIYSEVYRYNNGVRVGGEIKKLGKLIRKLTYDKKGLIIKNEKYSSGRPIHYTVYNYNKNNKITQSDQYGQNGLVVSWRYSYNKKGEVTNKQLFKEDILISQIKLSYKPNGQSKSKTLYSKGKPVKTLFYNNNNRVYRAIKYKDNNIDSTVIYIYNKKELVAQERLYNKVGKLDKVLVCVYNKKGQRIIEHGYDRQKQYIGSRVFSYNSFGKVIQEKRYNWLKKLIKVIYFNPDGKVTKIDNFEKKDGIN